MNIYKIPTEQIFSKINHNLKCSTSNTVRFAKVLGNRGRCESFFGMSAVKVSHHVFVYNYFETLRCSHKFINSMFLTHKRCQFKYFES